jgi:protoporphyrinogen oxidase
VIVIIGAGLSGLSAAKALTKEAGQEVLVLEKSNLPGGRVRTIDLEGYRLDLGFQICLDSYPAFRSILPVDSLEPCYLGAGALVEESPRELHLLANPFFHPGKFPELLTSPLSWADRLRLAKLAAGCLLTSDEKILAASGVRSREYLLEHEFSDSILESFFEPFFGGVFLDPDLETDSSLLRYYLKMFATGRGFLPKGGMGRMGEVLAAELPEGTVRYESNVLALEPGDERVAVHVEGRDKIEASAVILATTPHVTAQFLGWPEPPSRSVRVLYFQSPQPVYDGKWLVLPSKKPRFAQHFVQLTNIDPSLAPEGKHLLSSTVLGEPGLTERELFAAVKTEVTQLFPETGPQLQPLAHFDIPHALPAQIPGFRETYRRRAHLLSPRLRLAGDLASNASLQNALASGQRVAREVIEAGYA